MSEKYKTYPHGTFFVTLTVVGWIDVFTRAEYCELIVENLNYCVFNKGLGIYSYVLMPSHLHMVAYGEKPLNHILRDFKSYTSKIIIHSIQNNLARAKRSGCFIYSGILPKSLATVRKITFGKMVTMRLL